MDPKHIEKIADILRNEGVSDVNHIVSSLIENCDCDEREYLEVLTWLTGEQAACDAIVNRVGLNNCFGKWHRDPDTGDIYHESGGFFRIIGVDVKTDKRESGIGWSQPMIDQGTESSIAGLLKHKYSDSCKYLVEAKFEPGNYGMVQLSPGLQVTYSNLKQLHKGKKPFLSEYFVEDRENTKVLYEQWLPEDGGRFFLKRVKYMLVELSDADSLPEISSHFRWVKLSTLKKLLHHDNLINCHLRTLIAVL